MEQKDKIFRLSLFGGACRPFARFCGEKKPRNQTVPGLLKQRVLKSALAELRRAAGSLEAVLAYSLAPVFLDFMGFLASALKCCPSI